MTGIATAVINIGHRPANSQFGFRIMAVIKARIKVIEAAMDARETYRQIKTTAIHTPNATKTQIV